MQNRGGAETPRENQLTEKVIGCASEVHKTLGPGLLESARSTTSDVFEAFQKIGRIADEF